MSKELEALEGIKLALAKHLSKDTGVSVEKHLDYLENDTQIETITKALTPPTADEVCKALSEQLKEKVSYGVKEFYYKIENTECVMFVIETYGDGLWSINSYLPPHLITLIGRFYQGVEHERG